MLDLSQKFWTNFTVCIKQNHHLFEFGFLLSVKTLQIDLDARKSQLAALFVIFSKKRHYSVKRIFLDIPEQADPFPKKEE
jgi:hypothetical protein